LLQSKTSSMMRSEVLDCTSDRLRLGVVQSVAVCCSLFRSVAVCFSLFQSIRCVAVCFSLLQSVAVCFNRLDVLQSVMIGCVAVCDDWMCCI